MAFTRNAAVALRHALAATPPAPTPTTSTEVATRGADPRAPWGDSVPPTNSMVPTVASGIPVNQATAESIDTVFGCCSLIADSVSSLPVGLRTAKSWRKGTELPESPLLEQPYAGISRRDWWVMAMWSLALRGNFYGRKLAFDGDYPTQIEPLSNDEMKVTRLPDGSVEYRYAGKVIPPAQVFHVRFQSRAGAIVGLSPIQACALTMGTAIAQQRYQESFFLNNASPQGVIQVPGYLDRTETRKMYRGWLAGHQGINKAHLPAILSEGAEFKPISISPQDAELIAGMQWSAEAIAGRIFRVPPHMVGLIQKSPSWNRDLEQMERGFFSNTLVGYLTAMREALTALHPAGQFVHFDTTERTRGSSLERAQAAALLMNSGVGVADEMRAWFDLPDLPDGNGQQSFMPINSQLLKAALVALKQAEADPDASLNPGGVPKGSDTSGSAQGPVRTAVALLEAAVDQSAAQQRAVTDLLLTTRAGDR